MIKLDSIPQGYDDFCAWLEEYCGDFPNTEEGTKEALKWLLDSKYKSKIDDLGARALANGCLLGELIKRKVPNAKWLKDFTGLELSKGEECYPQNMLYKYYTGVETFEGVIVFYLFCIKFFNANNAKNL